MELSRLEIKGFKSFAEKISIHFHRGVTGVVGPNGCGKSNIVDAIRWVLGEQKTSVLRSEKMENIIFNGSQQRSSHNMAEVSLTINNTKNILPTEYEEITLTRRLYRSGESEYLINGIDCRLKDITNLFLGTGISSNSYAIIELPTVDNLLNNHNYSRRGLFEEATGIARYKKQKKESLKKLEDTDADLERIEDVLFEIKKNMKTLEKQAEQATKYYKIKDRYKEKSLLMAQITTKQHQEKHNHTTTRLEEYDDKKTQLNAQHKEYESRIEAQKTNLLEKEKALSECQKEINNQGASIQEKENEKHLQKEQLRFLTDKINLLQTQIQEDQANLGRTQQVQQKLENDKKEASVKRQETALKLADQQTEHDKQKKIITSLQSEIDTLREQSKKTQEILFQLSKETEIREFQISSLKHEKDQVNSDHSKQSTQLVTFEEKLLQTQQQITSHQQQLDHLKKEEDNTLQTIQQVEKKMNSIRETLSAYNRELDARQNEYQLTKSFVDNLEGFPEAIKFIRKNIGPNKQTVLLSDVIATSDKYRVPIENYLEPYLNYYIVNHEEDAYEAIHVLSQAGKGKAHFFILSAFDKFTADPPQKYPNTTPALHIIEYEPQYASLLTYLLQHVYIFHGEYKDIPVTKNSCFITHEGKIVKRQYELSGGSTGLFDGKRIGRIKNMEKLNHEIKTLSQKEETLRQSLHDEQRQLQHLQKHTHKQKIQNIEETLKQVNNEHISAKTQRDQLRHTITHADTRQQDIQTKIQVLSEEIKNLLPENQSTHQKAEVLENKLKEVHSNISQQTQILNQKFSDLNEQNNILHRQENTVDRLDQEIRHKQEVLQQIQTRIQTNTDTIEKHQQEIQNIHHTEKETETLLKTLYLEKEKTTKQLTQSEHQYYTCRDHISQLETQAKDLRQQQEKLGTQLLDLHHQLNEEKLHLNAVKERTSVEFQVDLDTLPPIDDHLIEPDSQEELTKSIDKLKKQLDNLPPVNPMAIEVYQEIKQRHDFICTQKEDLIKSKQSLHTTIHEIEDVATKTFLTSFEKIKTNFIEVFRTLFNPEDDCDLKLKNPADPLDSEIDIIAKPKGKRPIGIDQLSGGEKSLTATALLFSLYLLKPAPFCIFDEVDAPLDDINVDKFNSIVRKFSKDSQFIIVTHNKNTMITADIIYGITMIEKGVSKVVPVDLRQMA